MTTIAHPCLEIQTSEPPQPAVPPWFAETILLAQYLRTHGLLDAMTRQVRLVRGRFGRYEVIDFLALLFGYAISGERTLQAYFERLAPFACPFTAVFERGALPHRATLSRFLSAVDGPCLEALRALFASSSFTWGWTQETIGGLWDRAGRRYLLFDVDGTREAARQRALPCAPTLPPAKRRLDAVCAPGYQGRRRGEVVRTRTAVLQMHTRQWLGTFGGRGNGDYRGELARALRVVGTYLEAWDLPHAAGIIRLDGLYGDPAVIAQIVQSGLHVLGRGRSYALLEHPQVQAVLAQTVPVPVTSLESQVTYEVFDIPHVPLGPNQLCCRVILTRHACSGEHVAVGKLVGTWIYELFLTTLPTDGFLATDVLDLYHGRGAFEGTLADEDVEGDPDRWCSHSPVGQELWQVVWQWVWNLRLALGRQLVDEPVRAIEWAPPQAASTAALDIRCDPLAEEYGPWQWARTWGRATGRLGAEAFTLRADGQVQCPAGALLWPTETRQETADTQRRIFGASAADCRRCALRAACLGRGASGQRARRVSQWRRRAVAAPLVTTPPPTLHAAMTWRDVAGRRLRRTWSTHWQRQSVTIMELPLRLPALPRPARAARAHRRLGWDERLARNACVPLQLATIHVAGVPQLLVEMLGEGDKQLTRAEVPAQDHS
jgi:hypothetical protein